MWVKAFGSAPGGNSFSFFTFWAIILLEYILGRVKKKDPVQKAIVLPHRQQLVKTTRGHGGFIKTSVLVGQSGHVSLSTPHF